MEFSLQQALLLEEFVEFNVQLALLLQEFMEFNLQLALLLQEFLEFNCHMASHSITCHASEATVPLMTTFPVITTTRQ